MLVFITIQLYHLICREGYKVDKTVNSKQQTRVTQRYSLKNDQRLKQVWRLRCFEI